MLIRAINKHIDLKRLINDTNFVCRQDSASCKTSKLSNVRQVIYLPVQFLE